jgi:hypothetical protein
MSTHSSRSASERRGPAYKRNVISAPSRSSTSLAASNRLNASAGLNQSTRFPPVHFGRLIALTTPAWRMIASEGV